MSSGVVVPAGCFLVNYSLILYVIIVCTIIIWLKTFMGHNVHRSWYLLKNIWESPNKIVSPQEDLNFTIKTLLLKTVSWNLQKFSPTKVFNYNYSVS